MTLVVATVAVWRAVRELAAGGLLKDLAHLQVRQRGMKVTDSAGLSYHVEGIRAGRAYNGIPALTYLQVRQIL